MVLELNGVFGKLSSDGTVAEETSMDLDASIDFRSPVSTNGVDLPNNTPTACPAASVQPIGLASPPSSSPEHPSSHESDCNPFPQTPWRSPTPATPSKSAEQHSLAPAAVVPRPGLEHFHYLSSMTSFTTPTRPPSHAMTGSFGSPLSAFAYGSRPVIRDVVTDSAFEGSPTRQDGGATRAPQAPVFSPSPHIPNISSETSVTQKSAPLRKSTISPPPAPVPKLDASISPLSKNPQPFKGGSHAPDDNDGLALSTIDLVSSSSPGVRGSHDADRQPSTPMDVDPFVVKPAPAPQPLTNTHSDSQEASAQAWDPDVLNCIWPCGPPGELAYMCSHQMPVRDARRNNNLACTLASHLEWHLSQGHIAKPSPDHFLCRAGVNLALGCTGCDHSAMGKSIESLLGLAIHLMGTREHYGITTPMCHVCGITFSHRSSLRRHRRTACHREKAMQKAYMLGRSEPTTAARCFTMPNLSVSFTPWVGPKDASVCVGPPELSLGGGETLVTQTNAPLGASSIIPSPIALRPDSAINDQSMHGLVALAPAKFGTSDANDTPTLAAAYLPQSSSSSVKTRRRVEGTSSSLRGAKGTPNNAPRWQVRWVDPSLVNRGLARKKQSNTQETKALPFEIPLTNNVTSSVPAPKCPSIGAPQPTQLSLKHARDENALTPAAEERPSKRCRP